MYTPLSMLKRIRTISPSDAMRNRSTTVWSRQVCRWNAVSRLIVIRVGPCRAAIVAIEVGAAWSCTESLSRSLSVSSRQRRPPHHGPGPVACRDDAVAAAVTAHAAATRRVEKASRSLGGTGPTYQGAAERLEQAGYRGGRDETVSV